jgi:hypothetical protein
MSPADERLQMSDFLDKAEDIAEGIKDRIEDKLPDSIKEKLTVADEIPAEDVVES